jgi:hypothetical protein
MKNNVKTGHWWIFDNKRPYQVNSTTFWNILLADDARAELESYSFEFTDTGFINNANGEEYVYVAIAETVDGTSFFDTNAEEVIKGWQITDQYGITPDSPLTKRLGIAELTEQPTGAVQAFVPQGDKYHPIPDQSGAVSRAQSEAAEANERLDEANARITVLQTALESRIAALEADHTEIMDNNNTNGGY